MVYIFATMELTMPINDRGQRCDQPQVWASGGKRGKMAFFFFLNGRDLSMYKYCGGAPGEEAELTAVMANRGEMFPGG